MSKNVMGLDVAAEVFNEMCKALAIPVDKFNDSEKDEATKERLVNAIASGRLEFSPDTGDFLLKLLSPVEAGSKEVGSLTICEPDGVQLRAMSEVKKSNDDVGKGMSVLGSVTGLGLPVINKLKSRDLMVAIEVIGLFL